MKKKIVWLFLSSLLAVSLVMASCTTTEPEGDDEGQVVKGEVGQEVVQKEAPEAEEKAKEPVVEEKEKPKVPTSGWLEGAQSPTTAIGEPVYGGQINLRSTIDWENFDMYRYAGNSQWYTSFVFEKLAIGDWTVDRAVFNFPDTSGKVPEAFAVPNLASWDFPDPLTIILHVTPGIRWQDIPPVNGRAFDADDVVWNIERYLGSVFIEKMYFNMVESVTKIDNMTVQVKLAPPAQPFSQWGLLDTENHSYVPREAVDAESNQIEDWTRVIGTGPFMVDDFVPGSSVRYVRNPTYWREDERHPGNQLPYVDTLQVLIIPDLATGVAAFRTGQLDQMVGMAWKETQSIQQSNLEALVRSYPSSAGIIYRMRNDIEPFTDVRVRNAMQMAVDLGAIRDFFYQGQAFTYTPFVTFVHGDLYTPYGDLPQSVLDITTYNPEGARALLAEAGYPNGFKTEIVYVPIQNPGLAEVLQAFLADIGVEAELKPYEWPTFNSIRLGKQHQAIIQHWNWTMPSPIHLLNVFADPTHIFNLSAAGDPEYIALVNQMSTEFDTAKRNELIQKADYMTIEKSFYITMPQELISNIWHPWLRGYSGESYLSIFAFGQTYARLWIDQDMKAEMTGR